MGIDYNTTLELSIEGIRGNGITNARKTHHPKARHRATEFCKQIGLHAPQTQTNNATMDDLWTRKQETIQSQTDYFFFSNSISAENVKAVTINYDIFNRSEHRPVIADAAWPKILHLKSLETIKKYDC